MFEAYQLPENRDLIMNSILYEYLYLLASKFPRTSIPPKERKISYVEEALRYIENNYAHTVNIQVIADHLNIERTYLYRLFKDITGMSPQEYLLDYRIRRSCSLLKRLPFRSVISPGLLATMTPFISPGFSARKRDGRPPRTGKKNRDCRKTDSPFNITPLHTPLP